MEGDAGTVPVSTDPDEDQQSAGTEADDTAAVAGDESAEAAAAEHDEQAEATDSNPSRLGRRQLIGICALLMLLAAGLVGAGYLALRDHAASQVMARDNAEALEAAKSCVLATQAPDPGDMSLSQQKMLNCAAGEFRTQAALYAQILPPAYQAAKVHVELTEMGAAVERNNPDGSVDILVAFRIKVDNIEAQGREAGYRLRAQMVREDGQYRISKLDQVAR
ncbi:Mce protein [[Mycobacterium] nativiensis]|uniref:Mce protein n=1 Tax=[Mycobacterium] nativiensis TaxID=2855503 RepID=A0ABU5XZ25_9MYCO|nr:Mce protein [Mycolicibacter sp. MYC340]MEB3033012.1 Mce protein [Mycolicibacter sp. MYC340]